MSDCLHETFLLNKEQIDRVSEQIEAFSKFYHVERKNALRIRLTLEELLIRIMNHHSDQMTCELILEKKWGAGYAHIYYHGAPYNPIEESGNCDELSNQLLINLGLNPVWKYNSPTKVIYMMSMVMKAAPRRQSLPVSRIITKRSDDTCQKTTTTPCWYPARPKIL